MILNIKSLPVWEGTYRLPNRGYTQEFNLIFNEEINIFQQNNIFKTSYEDSDYKFITPPPGNSKYANALGDMYINDILEFVGGQKIDNVLEIGAGSNYIAKGIYKLNPYNLAILIDPAIKNNDMKNIKIINDYFPSKKLNKNKFDLVYSINTIEHVEDPYQFLMQIRNYVDEKSFLVFIFPVIEEQFKRGDIGSLLHEHINYFSQSSSSNLIKNSGFDILNTKIRNDEIVFYCKKSLLRNKRNLVNDSKEFEKLRKYILLMNKKINLNKERILNFHGKGLKIGFHGACNALSNFLFLNELNNLENIFIFDGDISKRDSYLPFSDKKILYNKDEAYKDMDILYIAATSFSKEIRLEAKKFLNEEKIIDLFS